SAYSWRFSGARIACFFTSQTPDLLSSTIYTKLDELTLRSPPSPAKAIASSNKLARTDKSALRYRILAKFWLHVEARSHINRNNLRNVLATFP
ncbi:hypothetical protein NDI37_21765, partial [Funiculus sociatus GB2-A5]